MTQMGGEQPDELSERDLEILEFERQWWKFPAVKEGAIRDRFDMSPTRYYQVLNVLIDRPAALAADAIVVRRLQRMRDQRRARRRSVAASFEV